MRFNMAILSISVPDNLAKASQEVASRLGVSRTHLIRQAIAHELEYLQLKFDQEVIIKSLTAMKNQQSYLEEAEEVEQELNSDLPVDKDEWWNK
jgi:predicted transcriptional regulator